MNLNGKKNKQPNLSALPYGKVPPKDVDLEKAVLGAILLEKDAIDAALEYLKPECFYIQAHRELFSCMVAMRNRVYPIDTLTAVDEYKKLEVRTWRDDEIPFQVSGLTNAVASSANIEEHCRRIKEKFIRREMIRHSAETIDLAYNDTTDAFELMETTSTFVNNLASDSYTQTGKPISTLVVSTAQKIVTLRARLAKNPDDFITGIPSGFRSIDRVTGGWQATDLIILAARPSVGKTALALNLARNAAVDALHKVPVAVFSLEMNEGQLTERMISSESGINLDQIQKGTLTDNEMALMYANGIIPLQRAPIFIDDAPGLSIMELKTKARKLKKTENIGLIIIDYLQLMISDKSSLKRNRQEEMAEVSRSLKALAKELKIPIIALSQMSREIEKTPNREPQLSDLRETGAIEQDADVVIFLTRDDYQMTGTVDPALKDCATAYIKKNRNGILKKIHLRTILRIQRWFTISDYDVFRRNYYDSDNPF